MSSSIEKRRHTFSSKERIKSKKLAQELFEEGSSFFLYPFIVRVLEVDDLDGVESPLQVMFAVPKKKIRLASTRNLVKRKLRESYRQKKGTLLDWLASNDRKLLMSLVYVAKEPNDFFFIEEKIDEILKEIPKKLN